MEDFINFNLPNAQLQQTKRIQCPKCAHKFYWITAQIGNATIGMMPPRCEKCGGNECKVIYE